MARGKVKKRALSPALALMLTPLDADYAPIASKSFIVPEAMLSLKQGVDKVFMNSISPGLVGQAIHSIVTQKEGEVTIESGEFPLSSLEMMFGGVMSKNTITQTVVEREEHTVAAIDGKGFELDLDNIDYSTLVLLKNEAAVTLTDTGDKVGLNAHGFATDKQIVLYDITGTTGLPTEGTVLYVKNPSTNDFEVSLTPSTGANTTIDLTTNGTANVYEVVSEDNFARPDKFLGLIQPLSTGTMPFAVNDIAYVNYTAKAYTQYHIPIGAVASGIYEVKMYSESTENPLQNNSGVLYRVVLSSESDIKFSSPKEFIMMKLTGTALLDPDAGAIGEFNQIDVT